MGGDGTEPFPWLLIAIVFIGFVVGFLVGLAFSVMVLP